MFFRANEMNKTICFCIDFNVLICLFSTFAVVKDDVATSYLATTIAIVYNVQWTQRISVNRLLCDGVDGRVD